MSHHPISLGVRIPFHLIEQQRSKLTSAGGLRFVSHGVCNVYVTMMFNKKVSVDDKKVGKETATHSF